MLGTNSAISYYTFKGNHISSLFITFMSITSNLFVVGTSSFTHMSMYGTYAQKIIQPVPDIH